MFIFWWRHITVLSSKLIAFACLVISAVLYVYVRSSYQSKILIKNQKWYWAEFIDILAITCLNRISQTCYESMPVLGFLGCNGGKRYSRTYSTNAVLWYIKQLICQLHSSKGVQPKLIVAVIDLAIQRDAANKCKYFLGKVFSEILATMKKLKKGGEKNRQDSMTPRLSHYV